MKIIYAILSILYAALLVKVMFFVDMSEPVPTTTQWATLAAVAGMGAMLFSAEARR